MSSPEENMESSQCQNECTEQPNLEWCIKGTSFTCPTDGSFSGVIPFTGKSVSLTSEGTISKNMPEGILAVTSINTKDASYTLFSKGSKIFFSNNITEPQIDLGAYILSLSTIKEGTGFTIIAATTESIHIIPTKVIADGSIEIINEHVKNISQIGGAYKIITSNSVDLSLKGDFSNLPPEISLSTSELSPKTKKLTPASNNTYIYLISAKQNLWRIKYDHLKFGGCFEKIYDSNDEKRIDKPLYVKNFDTVGQYVVAHVATSNKDLPKLEIGAENIWKEYYNSQLSDSDSFEPILNDFYWLTNNIILPNNSVEGLVIFDLLSKKDGSHIYLENNIANGPKYHPIDLMLIGNKLYTTIYTYDNTIFTGINQSDAINTLLTVWNGAKNGINISENQLAMSFINRSSPQLLQILIDEPIIMQNYTLPSIAYMNGIQETPLPIYNILLEGKDKYYVLGENKYFAEITQEPINMTLKLIPNAEIGTPWKASFSSNSNNIILSLIKLIELINIENMNANLFE